MLLSFYPSSSLSVFSCSFLILWMHSLPAVCLSFHAVFLSCGCIPFQQFVCLFMQSSYLVDAFPSSSLTIVQDFCSIYNSLFQMQLQNQERKMTMRQRDEAELQKKKDEQRQKVIIVLISNTTNYQHAILL